MFPVYKILGSLIAQLGYMLLSERVVRRVAVVTLRKLEKSAEENNMPTIKGYVDAIADAWEIDGTAKEKAE
jgi:hypothetical protein